MNNLKAADDVPVTAEMLSLLAANLPPLTFNPTLDSVWSKDNKVQAYLNFYGINFANEFPVTHGFGCLSLNGFRIATHYWLPAHPRGTLVLVHGYYDHVGVFAHAIRFGLEQNLAVLIYDMPGHGLSSGERGVIHSFDEYADVFSGLLTAAASLPGPRYGLGQSTGGSVYLNLMWRYPQQAEKFEAIVLCAPLILPRGWFLGQFIYALVKPWLKRVKRGSSLSSHDYDFIDFIERKDPLQTKTLSVEWVGAMKAWHQAFCGYEPKTNECLLVQGTHDQTVKWRYNLKTIARKLPALKIEYVSGAGHQLVNETDYFRVRIFARIQQYFFNRPPRH